jgi:hypothetical protein
VITSVEPGCIRAITRRAISGGSAFGVKADITCESILAANEPKRTSAPSL